MKRFLRLTFVYISALLLLYAVILGFISRTMNKDSIYTLPPGKTTLIIGASHSAYGINDTLMDGALNLSKAADSYVYVYEKLRKILPLNHNIHTVVLAFSELDVAERMQKLWLHSHGFINDKITNYFQLLTLPEIGYLFIHNPVDVIKSLAILPKSKSSFCFDILSSKNIKFSDLKFGNYEAIPRKEHKKESTIENTKSDVHKSKGELEDLALFNTLSKEDGNEVSHWQIDYLRKIIALCNSQHVKIILLRTPEIKNSVRENEKTFLDIVGGEFKNVPFIDCVKMDIPDSCFSDNNHLNVQGAAMFTDSLGRYLKGAAKF